MADARSTALLDMTLLPPLGEVLDLAAAQLAAWMPQQRWYAHKGAGAPQVEVAGWAPLRIAPDHATVLLVAAVHLGDGDRPAAGGTVDSRPDGAADGTTGAPDATDVGTLDVERVATTAAGGAADAVRRP